jgi:hypothetical protein
VLISAWFPAERFTVDNSQLVRFRNNDPIPLPGRSTRERQLTAPVQLHNGSWLAARLFPGWTNASGARAPTGRQSGTGPRRIEVPQRMILISDQIVKHSSACDHGKRLAYCGES